MSKKQFFLSMSKKQLISSLAVTGMMMGQMGGNVFANSNDDVNTLSTISSISNRAVSNDKVVVGDKIGNYVAGDKDLSLPHTQSMITKDPDRQPTTEENYGNQHEIIEISAPNNKTKDKFTVIENKANENQKSTSGLYKVEANVSDSGVDFTVTTTKGVTLGSLTNCNGNIDRKIEYKDMKSTVVYEFSYLFDGSGEHKIYINIGDVESGNVSPGTNGSVPGNNGQVNEQGNGQAGNNVNSGSGNAGTVSGNGSTGSQNGSSEAGPNVSETEKIDSEDKLINALNNVKNKEKVSIELEKNINITSNKELTIPSNVTIIGNGHTINLNSKASITLKGNDINVLNLIVKNSAKAGIQVYKSNNAKLDNVHVEGSANYGILVNSSTVTLNDCSTSKNTSGGIMCCRATNILTKHGGKDSKVVITGSLDQSNESSTKIIVKNSEMIDVNKANNVNYLMQDNKLDISKLKNKECYQKNGPKTQYKDFNTFYDTNVQKVLKGIKEFDVNKYKDHKFKEDTISYTLKVIK